MATSNQTKMQFATTLKDLMHHKPLDRITIAELSAATHVNRNTFYYHFEDIYGLLKWTLEADIGRKVMQNLGAATWEEFLFQSATDMVKPVVLDIDPTTPAKMVADICNFYGAAIVGQILLWLAQSLQEPERDLIKRADLMLNGSIAFIVHKQAHGKER